MLTHEFTNRYKKDLAKLIKRGVDVSLINVAVKKIINDEELGYEYRKHVLEPKNQIPKLWEIHLGGRKSDLLMIYYYLENGTHVVFDRVGSHSDLFR
ncbi:type II toxin-antitoxin system RelE/ParE family toxin [Streptococcus cuniculi]|uniref:Type II toxin-antitoxin system mRNA interferase toxin, RelE/StbE family n=1 Tax=Streptococcus cuniculi TaxID=1432788 RepID=A0A4Y9JDW6_9STRE|nr:type II toxin-antitoxin system mRNA interferase toxin, RelE/StbE family [Streptococcus cuniculi]MBF0777851.1 type II toxin-antitoxin system YafQ family toxin [Streptococcus cuniculi]TFU98149.1 type II toxin-antitoxin system mRNA interferase toxin, RelE/StbE family [Streptococcus cuniculi]